MNVRIAELWNRTGGLPSPLEAADIWRGIWFEEAHHSTAIEGNALRRADSGDCGELGELIARAVLDNLYKFVVPAVAGPARLVPLAALPTPGVTAGALRAAAVRGALQASKGPDGQWRSSRKWVDEYVTGRSQRVGRPRTPRS